MPFRLSKDARIGRLQWFRDLEDHGFDLDFDIYYLCLMAGLATGKKESVPMDASTQAPELVDYFPRGRIIDPSGRVTYETVALFLSKELEALQVLVCWSETKCIVRLH